MSLLTRAELRGLTFQGLDPGRIHRIGDLNYKLSAGDDSSVMRAVDNPDLVLFSVRQGVKAPFDEARGRPYIRSEINSTLKLTDNTVWLCFEIAMLDMRYAELSDEMGQAMICQVKSTPDHGAPVFRIDCCRDALVVRVSGNPEPAPDERWRSSRVIYKGPPMQELEWERFVARIELGPSGNGEVEMWRNGRRVLAMTGLPIGYGDKSAVYAKFGLYARESVKEMACLTTAMDFAPNKTDLLGQPF